ncbi:MAG TPA: dihydropteroate synthase [Candidatus Binataceae bacterium]|nr:dihydropteroate synthase [Candidatus Binataceae bacterium]
MGCTTEQAARAAASSRPNSTEALPDSVAAQGKRIPPLRLRDGTIVRYPAVMGILNITPDSFSDGGRFLDPMRACEHALQMEAEGAAIVDIGGESTRPGALEVSAAEELCRVMPVIEALQGKLRVPISIDTRKAVVARSALEAGAAIVNDVSGLTYDASMLPLIARHRAAVVVMHSRAAVDIKNHDGRYRDVVASVVSFLQRQASLAERGGVARSRIIVDPGLGFAKAARHNLEILVGFKRLAALGYPVLVGASRKRFVRRSTGGSDEEVRFGNAAVHAYAIAAGASIVRVHEVAAAVAVARMVAAIAACGRA